MSDGATETQETTAASKGLAVADFSVADAPVAGHVHHVEISAEAAQAAHKRPATGILHKSKQVGKRAGRAGLALILSLLVAAALLILAVLALTGKPLGLPIWAVAEIESRSNEMLSEAMPGITLSLGAVELVIDEDWTPRLRLEDLRLLQDSQRTLLALPDLRLSFDAQALVKHQVLRPASLRLIGGELRLRRLQDGSLDLELGSNGTTPPIHGISDLFALIDQALAVPVLSHLSLIQAEAASVTLSDARLGRVWTMGDGRLRLENRADALAAEFGMTLVGGGQAPAQALLTLVRPRGESVVRVSATVTDVAAADIAAQTPVLGWLGPLDSPISGRIIAEVNEDGLTTLDSELTLGKGALKPGPEAQPIGFDQAQLSLGYQPQTGRLQINALSVESQTLRLKADGHAYPIDGEGAILTGPLGSRLPQGFLGQVRITEAQIDPEGLFERPLVFTEGALETRLMLDPFRLEIGQVSLIEQAGSRLTLKGHAEAGPVGGWSVAMDVGLDHIAHDRLLQLWPQTAVPRTRDWVGQNVAKGKLTDVTAALRLSPGKEPQLSLNYDFEGAEARFLRTLPPITQGYGRQSIEGLTYTLVMDGGQIQAPLGGTINIAGSVFSVPNITEKPAQAEIHLRTDSSMTAALSLLDLPPFNFMAKAGRTPEMGEGRAKIETMLHVPLLRKVALSDVHYDVKGELLQLTSDRLVPKKVITADRLELRADPKGLTISGPGKIGKVPFDVTYHQGFGPSEKGKSQVTGNVTLSPATVEEFGLGLPQGMVSGSGQAQVQIDLQRGEPGKLQLTSDLRNITLSLPPVGWSKPANQAGKLEVQATLTQPPQIERLALSGGGLEAQGVVELAPEGGLKRARFGRVSLGGWLDAPVDLLGRGLGKPADIVVQGGSIDLRNLPALGGAKSQGGQATQGDIAVTLDRLRVAEGIFLSRFNGSFSQRGGFNGDFQGLLNGQVPVTGSVVPSRNGPAVRLRSHQGGEALRAVDIFKSARGGELDLQLTPRGAKRHYDGHATISNFRVRDASVLAELLSAVSVVGLLEQLNGEGILFYEGDAKFVLTPQAIEITEAAATGSSLGVSLSGLYATRTKQLALRGVVSPVYLLNGIGAALTRRGEGLFGFDYEVTGRSDALRVSVNPLSILTPGMFRDIFRRPAPVLRQAPK